MKILVTGACGFLARVLTRQLEASPHRHELVLLDRTTPAEATTFVPGQLERARAPFAVNWPFHEGEITDTDFMGRTAAGVDAVIHLAASVSGLPEIGYDTFHVNACGTFAVLDEARKAGVQRFLCASSINAFGTFYWRLSVRKVEYPQLPLTEDYPSVPEDPYSLSKLVNEETCAAFHRAYGITTAAFRFAGLWSHTMYDAAIANGLPPATEWAPDLFSWVHVEDIAAGLVRALECETLPGHGVYTLGAGDTRAAEPTMELLERFQPQLTSTLSSALPGRTPLLAIDKARAAFGYRPEYRLLPDPASS